MECASSAVWSVLVFLCFVYCMWRIDVKYSILLNTASMWVCGCVGGCVGACVGVWV